MNTTAISALTSTLRVVGEAGYIGSHRTKHLLRRRSDVVTFGNLSTGYRGAVLGGDPARLVADSAAARRALGWNPQLADLDTPIRHAWQRECKACPANLVELN